MNFDYIIYNAYHKLAPLQTKDYKDLSQALDDDEDFMPPLSQYDSGSESDEFQTKKSKARDISLTTIYSFKNKTKRANCNFIAI